MCLFLCILVCLFVFLFVCLFFCLFVCLFVFCLFVCLFVCMFVEVKTPTQLTILSDEVVRHVACGDEHTALLTQVHTKN